jgi:hypothetical protein
MSSEARYFIPVCLFELGKGQEHIESQPAHGGRGIELLGDRDKRYALGIEQFDQLGEVRQ